MKDEFSTFSLKNWSFFTGTIVVTTLVVAGLYGWIYGFNYLGKSAAGAGRVLVAAFNGQAVPTMQPTQPVMQYPQVQVPVAQYNYPVQSQPVQAGQFVCATHGAVGMPLYGQGGVPQCPICGQIMQFYSSGYQGTVAAWNNGAGGG
jgi:hypothetical protein